MATFINTAKTIFEAEDRTAAGHASVQATLGRTEAQAKKTSKAIAGAAEAATPQFGILGTAINKAHGQMKNFSQTGEKLQQMNEFLGKSMFPVTAGLAGIAAAIAAVQKASEQMGAQLGKRAIMGNLPFEIEQARDSTHGLVEDTALAKAALAANRGELVSSAQGFADLAEAGSRLGMATGQDAGAGIDALTEALASSSEEGLKALGVNLTQVEAETRYAQQLGVTRDALTASQQAEAFRTIGLQEATKASDELNLSLTESEQAWANANKSFDKLGRETAPALTESTKGMWEGLEGASELASDAMPALLMALDALARGLKVVFYPVKKVAEVWALLGEGIEASTPYLESATVWVRGLGQAAKEAIPFTEELGQAWAWVEDVTGTTEKAAGNLTAIANAQAQIVGWLERGKVIAGETVTHEADRRAALETAVTMADHMVALGQAQGKDAKELERLYQAQYAAKVDLLRATGDQAALDKLLKDEEVRQARNSAKKKGGGSGPTDADRLKATGEIQLKVWEQRLALMEVEASLAGTTEETALRTAEIRRDLAIEELNLEAQVLEITRGKTSIEREQISARLAAIEGEKELVYLRAQEEAQETLNKLIETAVKLSTERANQEAKATERVSERANLELTEQEALSQYRQEVALRTERNAFKRLDIERRGEIELAALAKQRLANEDKAQKAALDARQANLDSQSGGSEIEQLQRQEEYRQLAHDRELQRLGIEAEARRLLEQEKSAAFMADQARSEATWAMVEDSLGAFEQFKGQVTELGSFFSERNKANEDADHANYITSLNAKGEAQQASLDRQIKAAQGNAQLVHKLEKRKEEQAKNLRKQVEQAEAKHQEKRKKQEMRHAGAMLLIEAAVEAVRAVISFASQNYLEGAMHTAAAIFAGVQGGVLMSGQIPGAGGGGGGGGAGGGGMSAGSTTEALDPSNVPGSTPGAAAQREAATPRNGTGGGSSAGTTVVINGGVNAWGNVDDTVAEDLARHIDRVGRSKEK